VNYHSLDRTAAGSSSTKAALDAADIIVTTPEKWDSITRRWKAYAKPLAEVKLVCVDEVHTIGDDRGAALEAVIARIKMTSEARIIALSATLPNVVDIGKWLQVPIEYCFSFDDTYRPVPVSTHVIGVNSTCTHMSIPPHTYCVAHIHHEYTCICAGNASGFLFEKQLDYQCLNLVQRYSSGKPTLIFCSSRGGVKTTASQICKDLLKPTAYAHNTLFADALQREECVKASARAKDSQLRDALRSGVGFHSAAENIEDRQLVEQLFLAGKLPVLCTTTTLSMGT
jgi:ATP-dependent DNA helicase HFM1/MER3